jgi:hypothetical protein
LAPPPGVEAKADDAIEQVIATRNPIEHILNGSVARSVNGGHRLGCLG